MKRSIWLGITLALLAACAPILRAQEAAAPITDPAQVRAHYEEVVARPEYRVEEPGLDLRWKNDLAHWLMGLGTRFENYRYQGQISALAGVLFTGLIIVGGIGLIYVTVRLLRRWREGNPDAVEEADSGKIPCTPESYENELHEAVAALDWRRAWMAAWRQFLARLEFRHLVEADRTQTNREYLGQLRHHALPAATLGLLDGMVSDYDLHIYGPRAIGEAEWRGFRVRVNEAALLLHLDEKAATGGAA